MSQDLDALHDRQLARETSEHCDARYGRLELTEAEYAAKQRAESDAKITRALKWAEQYINEPAEDVIRWVKEEFGLTYAELETLIHRWVMSNPKPADGISGL